MCQGVLMVGNVGNGDDIQTFGRTAGTKNVEAYE